MDLSRGPRLIRAVWFMFMYFLLSFFSPFWHFYVSFFRQYSVFKFRKLKGKKSIPTWNYTIHMWGGALGAAAREGDQDSRSIIVAIFIEKNLFWQTARYWYSFFQGQAGGITFCVSSQVYSGICFLGGRPFWESLDLVLWQLFSLNISFPREETGNERNKSFLN